MKYDVRLQELQNKLDELMSSEFIVYNQLRKLNKPGIYVAYIGESIIYVGKTGRMIKKRIGEMYSDYRSHTLNRKLLTDLLNKKYVLGLEKLKKDSKKELIDKGVISETNFKNAQYEINEYVQSKLKFKYIFLPNNELTKFEHFVIAILNPKYND